MEIFSSIQFSQYIFYLQIRIGRIISLWTLGTLHILLLNMVGHKWLHLCRKEDPSMLRKFITKLWEPSSVWLSGCKKSWRI